MISTDLAKQNAVFKKNTKKYCKQGKTELVHKDFVKQMIVSKMSNFGKTGDSKLDAYLTVYRKMYEELYNHIESVADQNHGFIVKGSLFNILDATLDTVRAAE